MKIRPYECIDSLRFGESTKADCIALYGQPKNVRKNRYNVEEYRYDDFTLRFDLTNNTLRECTLLPCKDAVLGSIPVTWDRDFLVAACNEDGNPVEANGFIVMLKLGIAVTGIHDNDDSQLAVTAFSKGVFDDVLVGAKAFDVAAVKS
jgi:hypothetical protein